MTAQFVAETAPAAAPIATINRSLPKSNTLACAARKHSYWRSPADTTMLGHVDTILRTRKAAPIADRRDETGGDDQIDTRDREQPLDRQIIASCRCDLRIENPGSSFSRSTLRRCRSSPSAASSSARVALCSSALSP